MLRIAEHFHDSDLGRQRQGNEDNYFVRAPLFVVADGMGGAQAGEVASEIAVRQFEGGLPDGRAPAEALVELIQAANARIHDEARADAQRAGMGTTLTAAYVAGDTVVVAHVGDSRCYLFRDGDLIRLTRDHGAGADVEVDVEVFPARDGDLFMVCSDGLTGMVHEPQLKPLLEKSGSLEQVGRSLISAANEAGGRDNITVILFRLEDTDGRTTAGGGGAVTVESDAALTAEYDTFTGEAVAPRQGVSKPSAVVDDAAEAEYRRTGTVALQAVPGPEGGSTAPAREPPPWTAPLPSGERPARRRRRRGGGVVLLLLGLVLPLLIGAWLATRAVYFVGTDPGDDRTVAIFRGLPYELPFGIELYERWYASGVTLEQVPPARRPTFTDHRLRSRDDAEDLVRALERGSLE